MTNVETQVNHANNKDLLYYILRTFLITWFSYGIMLVAINCGYLIFDSFGCSVIFGIGALGPAIAVWLMFRHWTGACKRASYWRFAFGIKQVATSVIIVFLFFAWRFIISNLFGTMIAGGSLLLVLSHIPRMFLYGGLEEIGWRGFLQPYFENRLPFVLATIATALIWSAWHIPLWFVAGSPQYGTGFLTFVLSTTVIAFTLATIRKLTNSVLPCIICHTLHNALFTVWVLEANAGIIIAFAVELIMAITLSTLYDKHKISKVRSD